ncbi:hypothetical protein BDN72DRAFT_842644 [Pluteus cervinus]|uniref:Uncharacterized protein n=1 Tax=Pluteus cervinus TaxID=181527 RepID=A0ACD3AQ50_9AGAR|nr:hypothetical protein BDN72DRAFT_842644 [Pluteus cervinus]
MAPLSVVRIVVSCNAEQYNVVDLTGAPNGSSVREQIFYKLGIPEDSQRYYSVYQSEIGSYAIGGALSNAVLFNVCQELGDPSGSLKFFVSTFPDRPPSQYAPTTYNTSCVPRIR